MRWWVIVLSAGLGACGGNVEQPAAGGSGGSAAGGTSAGGSGGSATGGTGGSSTTPCTVVATEALPGAVADDATLTGPAVAATDSGFMLGYRDQSGDELRSVLLFVSDAGVSGEPNYFDLAGCAGKVPTDGVGMAYASGQGLYASSLPNCGAGAGAVFIPFDSNGLASSAAGPRNASFTELTVAQTASLAPAAASGEYELVYRVVSALGPVVERVVLDGPDFKNIPIVHPFGEDDVPYGRVATSGELRAFLTRRPSALELQVGPMAGDSVDTKGTLELPLADASAMIAWKSFVAVVSARPEGPVLSAARLSGSTLQKLAEGPVGSGGYQGVDLAVDSSRLFVVGGLTGVVHLYGIPLQNDAPNLDTTWPRIELTGADQPALGQFDGRLVAARAARGKVLVTWLSKQKLAGEATGGWALLACDP